MRPVSPLPTRLALLVAILRFLAFSGILAIVWVIFVTLSDGYPLGQQLREAPLGVLLFLGAPVAFEYAARLVRRRDPRAGYVVGASLLLFPAVNWFSRAERPSVGLLSLGLLGLLMYAWPLLGSGAEGNATHRPPTG